MYSQQNTGIVHINRICSEHRYYFTSCNYIFTSSSSAAGFALLRALSARGVVDHNSNLPSAWEFYQDHQISLLNGAAWPYLTNGNITCLPSVFNSALTFLTDTVLLCELSINHVYMFNFTCCWDLFSLPYWIALWPFNLFLFLPQSLLWKYVVVVLDLRKPIHSLLQQVSRLQEQWERQKGTGFLYVI